MYIDAQALRKRYHARKAVIFKDTDGERYDWLTADTAEEAVQKIREHYTGYATNKDYMEDTKERCKGKYLINDSDEAAFLKSLERARMIKIHKGRI